MALAFDIKRMKIQKFILFISLFFLDQCLTILDSPVDFSEAKKKSKYNYASEICVSVITLGIDHKFEISNFSQVIIEDLAQKGFTKVVFKEFNENPNCQFLLQYKKIKYSKAILELLIFGYPMIKGNEIELDAFEYSKDQKLLRHVTFKNGYQHYISWLLLPTFFIFYRPFTDEKIIEDFHHQFFRQMNNLESQNYP
ncbi:hypothetical protein QMN07_07760 [Leptospira santarosai]|uniref:hypothetical protein n=1 Tax=Leptospira santarosai TaxID=28183 RepID=UPI0012BB06B6|nr:hypothetical protein [Leptospira santarosai]MDI7217416.1 hypothetical protein [Leptospira santarosai]